MRTRALFSHGQLYAELDAADADMGRGKFETWDEMFRSYLPFSGGGWRPVWVEAAAVDLRFMQWRRRDDGCGLFYYRWDEVRDLAELADYETGEPL